MTLSSEAQRLLELARKASDFAMTVDECYQYINEAPDMAALIRAQAARIEELEHQVAEHWRSTQSGDCDREDAPSGDEP